MEECEICRHLRAWLSDNDFETVPLGSFDQILKDSCPGHAPLFQCVRDRTTVPEPVTVQINSGGRHIEVLGPTGMVIDFVEVRPVRSEKFGDRIGASGRIINPKWVDMDVVRQWMQECFSQHSEECVNPLNIEHTSPAWLIDTTKQCLVPGEGIVDYITLSYRWGSSTGFLADGGSLERLQEPGALSDPEIAFRIPPTIKHAIKIVQNIGERYLWVDAICIVQDDAQHTTKQLELMGAIYSSSKLTIVSSGGDAMEGIKGLEGISEPRKWEQQIVPVFESERVIIPNEFYYSRSQKTIPYFQRGWTYQEYILAKRRLVFSEKQTYWCCACAVWFEEEAFETKGPNFMTYFDMYFKDIMEGMADLRWLNQMIRDYTQRDFTYSEDVVSGSMGFLGILSQVFEGGFLFGLPEMCFDSALLWALQRDQKASSRRSSSERSKKLTSITKIPSWSPFTWRAGVELVHEESYKVQDIRRPRTFPTTEWYTQRSPTSTEKRRIWSTWFTTHAEQIERLRNPSIKPPESWTREVADAAVFKFARKLVTVAPEGFGEYWYRQTGNSFAGSWCPMPAKPSEGSIKPFMPPQTPYVSCVTRRIWVSIDGPPTVAEDHRLFEFLDTAGDVCGRLTIDCEDDVDALVLEHSKWTTTIELVEVCRQRRIYEKVKEEEEEDLGDHGENKSTGVEGLGATPRIRNHIYRGAFGFLWVEWRDGVAYRKGVGYMWEDYWEKRNPQQVDLILG